METQINRFALKALLLDTMTYVNTGSHLYPSWRNVKRRFCAAKGCPQNIPAELLLGHIGKVYEDNGLVEDFKKTINKFGFDIEEAEK